MSRTAFLLLITVLCVGACTKRPEPPSYVERGAKTDRLDSTQPSPKPAPVADAQQVTDEQICRMRIAAYIDNYNGPCPCPYNTKSNGSKCGGNSAYDRAGGNSKPLCFLKDCTPEMITQFRASL